MATLQTARQNSAFTAKSRLKQVVRDRVEQKATVPDATTTEHVVESFSSHSAPTRSASAPTMTKQYPGHLTDMEQRQLLLQTVTVYEGWHLVSVQNRPESDVLVAYLVRNRDNGDPSEAIREGRALQIIMDAIGDLKIQHPRRKSQQPSWRRWLSRLTAVLTR